ncbi:sigma-70 family RNA polymerase sigma factor [Methylobacterium mesophilicum SR1.6/6]|uniref:Sigma-70 family RNA polymerase sigma factor n=1 Tax=Methylobacterium mesophilicum SR1.6/6 TaxID=908290 RepID=A0A6B9FI26_9HYPH|nr:sigma-70 family RNA polymerase sigma factor [Methylobacterium mesophilicum]QGY02183.1 sigma-70 family RNA polymerase sigma factor [Methylobacterium mesophilicum SR1.6/6]
MTLDKQKRPDIIDLLVPLRRYARSLTRDALRADDLVHDTLVRALEMQHSLRPNTNLRTWMMTVLHNAFIDEQRRRQVEARHADTLVRMAEDMAPPAQEGRVRLAQIRQAFLTLPEEQRAALHLVTLEGMAYADAAAVLGIPIGTLMSRLGRGRAALRAFEEGGRADRPTDEAEPGASAPGARRGPPSALRLVVSDEPKGRSGWPLRRAAGEN